MKSKFTWIFTLFLAFFIQFAFAQEKTITGVVTDAGGLSIPSANVTIVGTTTGVQTDFDGKYAITASVGQKLQFSYIGFATQVVTVGASNTISVKLEEDVKVLDDVVVEAYRSTVKERSSIASTTVTAKTIENRPNASFVQTLQGQIPGLNISSGSGQPGSNNTTVILRGVGSINGNIEPLYVIDGVPQNSDNFRSLNPNDIATVSVLKDAGATSIYGNRGANGVIIVKTKRGGYDSKLQIKYTGSTGFNMLQNNKYDVMNSQQLLTLQRSVGRGAGANGFKNDSNLYPGVPLTDAQIAAAPNFDWQKYFFRTGVVQNHVLGLTSGGKNLSSFTSIGYTSQEGILKNTDLKRVNFRNNLNGKSDNGRFNYATSVTVNYSVTNAASSLGTGGVNQNYVIGAIQALPYVTADQYTNGADLTKKVTLDNTPLFLIDKLNTYINKSDETKMIGQGQVSYKLTDDLVAGATFGIDYTNIIGLTNEAPQSFNALYFAQLDQEFVGYQSESYSRSVALNTNASLTYTKTFGEKHTLEAAAFTEYFKAHSKGFGYGQNGLDPNFYAPGTGKGFISYQNDNNFYVPEDFSSKAESGLFSYFGSVDYDYDSKYGFSGTIRRDASYRFADTNKWGTFWSVAGRWNIDKEDFMKNAGFDMLKLRASYGTAGNQDVLGTGVFGGASLSRYQYAVTSGYNNGPGYVITQLANPTLKWETITQANIGLDFALLKNRLRGTFDVYRKTTDDLYQGLPISALNAITQIYANYGSLRNSGVEAQVSYQIIDGKDFKLGVNFNGSYNKNELLNLPGSTGVVWDGGLTANKEGGRLEQYYLVKYAGVNPANGNLLFYDKDHNLTETPNDTDRQYTNKSAIPKYQGGFGLNADYKNFFLTAMFTYVAGVYRFDYDLANFQDPSDMDNFNKSTDLLRAWTPDNRITDIPSLYANNTSYAAFSDRNLKDASYVRMRYVTLGYNFTPKLLQDTPFTQIRIYGQAENLLTWTKWRGFDAESNRGADQAQYPTPKIISLGLELQF